MGQAAAVIGQAASLSLWGKERNRRPGHAAANFRYPGQKLRCWNSHAIVRRHTATAPLDTIAALFHHENEGALEFRIVAEHCFTDAAGRHG